MADEDATIPAEVLDEPLPDSPTFYLTAEQVATGLSVLARTGTGLAHAYVKLELHGTGATNIDIVENYPHLRYLDLSDNNVRNIEPIKKLEFLLSVNFASNQLETLPESLDNRKYLQQANFTKNFLKSVNILNMPMLVHLTLNQNRLTNLELNNFPELSILEVRENQLTKVNIKYAPKLKHIHVSFNKLATVEGFANSPLLESAYFRNNQISTLDMFSSANQHLLHLNLRHNLVASLSEVDRLRPLTSLRSINFMENPICEVENYRMEVLIRLPHLDKIDKDNVTPEERDEAKKLAMERAKTTVDPKQPEAISVA